MTSRISFKGLPTVNFDGVDVPLSAIASTLGVTFDQSLSFAPPVSVINK